MAFFYFEISMRLPKIIYWSGWSHLNPAWGQPMRPYMLLPSKSYQFLLLYKSWSYQVHYNPIPPTRWILFLPSHASTTATASSDLESYLSIFLHPWLILHCDKKIKKKNQSKKKKERRKKNKHSVMVESWFF